MPKRAAPTCRCPGPAGRNGFPHPTGTPDGYQAPLVAPNLVTLAERAVQPQRPVAAARRDQHASATTSRRSRTCVAPDGFGPPDPNECNLALPVAGDLHACASCARRVRPRVRPSAGAGRQPRAGDGGRDQPLLHDQLPARLVLRRRLRRGVRQRAGRATSAAAASAGDSILAEAQDYSGTNNAEHDDAGRRRSGRGCACTCGRARPRSPR